MHLWPLDIAWLVREEKGGAQPSSFSRPLRTLPFLMSSTSRRRLVGYRGNAANSMAQRNKTCTPRWPHRSGCPIGPFPATHETGLTKFILGLFYVMIRRPPRVGEE